MRALSICQPFASLILLPQNDPRHKRVENRTWKWVPEWTGDFLIHASKGRKYLKGNNYGLSEDDMPFGALVGVAKLVGAIRVDPDKLTLPVEAVQKWPWLRDHQHVEGPVCLILQEIRRIREPIKYFGQLGVFQVPDNVLEGAELLPVDVL